MVEIAAEDLEAARAAAFAPPPEEDEAAGADAPEPQTTRRTPRAVPAPSRPGLKPLVARHAAANDLPFELADAVVLLESRYDPAARNGPFVGLTQIHAATARSLGYKGAVDGLLDPDTNLRFGLRYLAQAYRLADGDTCGTILRYRAGHRTTVMSAAAQRYCAKVKTIIAQAG